MSIDILLKIDLNYLFIGLFAEIMWFVSIVYNIYSASSLKSPFLWFSVNVFVYKMYL